MILAIVQARMASTRLPGKVMKEISGKPIIGYLFERLSCSKMLDKIILATAPNSSNDELCEYIKGIGFDVFRGSEGDVVERFYLAAGKYNSETIIRVTGDCPLIDPKLCDKLFAAFFNAKADYAEFSPDYAEGADCEIFTYKALEEAYNKASLKSEREHVTLYFNNHLDQFRKYIYPNKTDDSKYRFTVDEPEDFSVVKSIFGNLYRGSKDPFTYQEIKEFLDNYPDIYQLNHHIIRNEGLAVSLKNDCEVKIRKE